jgi:uncharacterized protein
LSEPTVLIASFSGRALAASARRAGYRPLVVDCFGDTDLQDVAADWRCLPARVQVGFRRKSLTAALNDLAVAQDQPPIGLLLGAGFECAPALIQHLSQHFRLLGNDGETVEKAKNPKTLFPLLDQLGIPYPETRLAPPSTPEGWLMKRIGGSGGLHIVPCPSTVRPDPKRYFQRQLPDGEPVSVTVVAGALSSFFALTRQWCHPLKRRPYRYGGAVSAITIDASLEQRLVTAAHKVVEALGLKGLLSVDFLVTGDDIQLLEVNPRPGAALDVLDDANGRLFQAHIACADDNGDPVHILKDHWRLRRARAQAYLYADRGAITVGNINWPDWTADRPVAGTQVRRRQPLATVLADAASADEAELLCQQRLAELADMLYEGQKEKEKHS